MKLLFTGSLLLLFGSIHTSLGQNVVLITPHSVTSSTSASDFYPVGNLRDGSGMIEMPSYPLTTAMKQLETLPSSTWVTTGYGASDYFASGGPNPQITFHFLEQRVILGIVVWGYPLAGATGNEAKTFMIEFSNDGGNTYFFTSGSFSSSAPLGNGWQAFVGSSPHIANAVRLTILDNYAGDPASDGGGNRVGLGEIRFLDRTPNNLITVTNKNNSGGGSLRQAISDSSQNGKIVFDSSLNGETIRLDSPLNIPSTKDLFIDASALANGLTISGDTTGDGSGDVQVFTTGAGSHLRLSSLTISAGKAPSGIDGYNISGQSGTSGGGIRSLGSLLMADCTLSGCSAGSGGNTGGTGNGGAGGHGGGIYAEDSVSLIRSAIISNAAGSGGNADQSGGLGGSGGGLYCTGTGCATIFNSTLAGNWAGDAGSGSPSGGGGVGGAIAYPGSSTFFSTLALVNSTIYLNFPGTSGGVISGGGSVAIGNCGLGLQNLLVARTFGAFALPDFALPYGGIYTWFDRGRHLIAVGDGFFPAGTPNVNGDFVGSQSGGALDPKLGNLVSNGGSTVTFLPGPGSFAIDPPGGDAASLASTDQRAAPRVTGGIVDIGAVEARGFQPDLSIGTRPTQLRGNNVYSPSGAGQSISTRFTSRSRFSRFFSQVENDGDRQTIRFNMRTPPRKRGYRLNTIQSGTGNVSAAVHLGSLSLPDMEPGASFRFVTYVSPIRRILKRIKRRQRTFLVPTARSIVAPLRDVTRNTLTWTAR